jgi:hypothetical protein
MGIPYLLMFASPLELRILIELGKTMKKLDADVSQVCQ